MMWAKSALKQAEAVAREMLSKQEACAPVTNPDGSASMYHVVTDVSKLRLCFGQLTVDNQVVYMGLIS